jgi:hypothetical protein
MLNVAEVIHVDDGVAIRNTPPGVNVTVPLTNPAGVPSVTLTFAQVSTAGQSTYTTATKAPPLPDGFRLGQPGVVFDITTTAVYSAPVRVCVSFDAAAFANVFLLRLFHYENGAWVDHTLSVDKVAHTVCAVVNSLSPFAVLEPIPVDGRMTGDGEIRDGSREQEFEFVASAIAGHKRGGIKYTVRVSEERGQRATRDRFESTAVTSVVIWNEPGIAPGRGATPIGDSVLFAGIGKWNGVAGYRFEARATDAGEPGRGRDSFAIAIFDPGGALVAATNGIIEAGNIQSERVGRNQERER